MALALAILAQAALALAGPLDAFWPYLWWVHRLEAPTAWREIGPGPRILVAIIDSGVDLGHPDLADRILRDAENGSCTTWLTRIRHRLASATKASQSSTESTKWYRPFRGPPSAIMQRS